MGEGLGGRRRSLYSWFIVERYHILVAPREMVYTRVYLFRAVTFLPFPFHIHLTYPNTSPSPSATTPHPSSLASRLQLSSPTPRKVFFPGYFFQWDTVSVLKDPRLEIILASFEENSSKTKPKKYYEHLPYLTITPPHKI